MPAVSGRWRGGEVPLGVPGDFTADDTQVVRIVEQVVTARLLAALNLETDR